MLRQVADGVFVHESACIQTTSTVVRGEGGVLVIDPGLTDSELTDLAAGIRRLGQPVVAGFATHPDWDHALWHADLGDVPRYGTARGVAWLRDFLAQPDWRDQIDGAIPDEVRGQLPLDLFGLLTPLLPDAVELPWAGPTTRVIEHRAHAVGHAALLIEGRGVLVAGDMLSDVLVPMPDLYGGEDDPLGDYLAALELFEGVASQVEVVIPGHGSVGDAAEFRARLDRDRRYIEALRTGADAHDPRVEQPKPGWEWVGQYIHEGNVEHAR